ncbi:hypothetical protein [Lichenibacterium dinghuense]|uniref:hypothetical protein n=1 Tax=Lichenibacterium dinghuense TaxID=2895977 RepID=UPI001F21BBF5|nr:hypothetical protein [Lichenibacterium sp. 6Y81]
MTDLDHLNSRERAYRLAQRKARMDRGEGVDAFDALPTPSECAAEAAIRFEVEAVKVNVADLAHRHGFAFGWFGDQLRLQFPESPEVLSVEEAVRRNLIGPGRVW